MHDLSTPSAPPVLFMSTSDGATFVLHTLLLTFTFTFTYGEDRDSACGYDEGRRAHGDEDHGEDQPHRGDIF